MNSQLDYCKNELFVENKALTASMLTSSLSIDRPTAISLLNTLNSTSSDLTPSYIVSGVSPTSNQGVLKLVHSESSKDELQKSLKEGSVSEIYSLSKVVTPTKELEAASIEFENCVKERLLSGEENLLTDIGIISSTAHIRKKRARGIHVTVEEIAYSGKKSKTVTAGSGSGGFASNAKATMSRKPQNTKEFFGGDKTIKLKKDNKGSGAGVNGGSNEEATTEGEKAEVPEEKKEPTKKSIFESTKVPGKKSFFASSATTSKKSAAKPAAKSAAKSAAKPAAKKNPAAIPSKPAPKPVKLDSKSAAKRRVLDDSDDEDDDGTGFLDVSSHVDVDVDVDVELKEECEKENLESEGRGGNCDDFVGDDDEDSEDEADRKQREDKRIAAELREKEEKKERRKLAAAERKREKEAQKKLEKERQMELSDDEDNFDDSHNEVSGAMDAFATKSKSPPAKDQRILKDGKRRVIKKRMVEKMTTDEKGFMHCEMYEEEYSSEEDYDPNIDSSPSPGKKTKFNSPERIKKKQAAAAASKGSPKKQAGLLGFFAKKK